MISQDEQHLRGLSEKWESEYLNEMAAGGASIAGAIFLALKEASNPTPDHNVTRDNHQPVSPGATPRTDREQYQVIPGADHKEDAVVSVDFARELERENTALRARLEAAEQKRDDPFELTGRFHEWLAGLGLKTIRIQDAYDLADLRAECAKLRECAEKLAEQLEWTQGVCAETPTGSSNPEFEGSPVSKARVRSMQQALASYRALAGEGAGK